MKKIMTMVSAIMMVATANAETKNVAPFYEVNVNVPARIRVIKGNDYDVNVRTREDANTLNIQYTVEDGVLKISSLDDQAMNADSRNVMITITVPNDDTNVTAGRSVIIKNDKKISRTNDFASL